MQGLFIACLVLMVLPASPPAQGAGRVRPPDAVTCPRDNLTLYAGRVLAMDRQRDSTTLTIATDWKTTERVKITHPNSGDPAASFLMKGKPFVKADWALIATDGKLRDGARASAWVCSDGRNPVIDWEVKTRSGAGKEVGSLFAVHDPGQRKDSRPRFQRPAKRLPTSFSRYLPKRYLENMAWALLN